MSMEELKEWDNNPRKMRVWGGNYYDNTEAYVVVKLTPEQDPESTFHVIAKSRFDVNGFERWKHCAEIEEMATHKQLARWLRKKPNREYMLGETHIYSTHTYTTSEENEPLDDDSLVREGDGEWKKPLKSLLDEN